MSFYKRLHCPCCGEPVFEDASEIRDVTGKLVLRENRLHGPLGNVKVKSQIQLICKALLLAQGGTVTATRLYDMLYWDRPEDKQPEPHIIRVRISETRQKARVVGAFIENVPGYGYRLAVMDHPVKPGDDKLAE